MAFYAALDGGGTKTRCVLGDETSVLATAVAGGSNIVRLGEEAAGEALRNALTQVSAAARVTLSQIRAVCIGAAGAGRPEVAERVRAVIAGIVPEVAPSQIRVVGDHEIALESAFGSGPGVVAIAGTGSVVFGRDADGRTARAGGWGFAISDEGSGQWIGRQAVSAVLRARDEGRETALSAAILGTLILETLILETWELADLDALIAYANATPPPEFPRLFPVVLRAADAGDATARELLARAGKELASLASIVVNRIAPAPPYIAVATTGSVFRQSQVVRDVFYNRLNADFPGLERGEASVDPVMGALALARSMSAAKAR